MKLDCFDFSNENVSIDQIHNHVRYYYTKALIALDTAEKNKKDAMSIYKEIRDNLKNEYREYEKAKNWKYIHNNKLYSQYKDNIVNAHIKPTNVTSYRNLNSNLYDVYDYMHNGFLDYLKGKNKIDLKKLENLLNEKCKIVTKDFLVFEGEITDICLDKGYLKIHDFEDYNKLLLEDIDTIDKINSST